MRPADVSQAGWQPWAEAGGFGALFAPQAIGIDFYCILQDDGLCGTPPGPVGLLADEVINGFGGDGALGDLADPADAVTAGPRFTG